MTDHMNSRNVDPAEIRKFSDLAAKWWDPGSAFKALHDINPLRLNYIDQHAPLKGKKVLDVGCGGGILSESMAHLGADVTGIDMAEASLHVAKLHALQSAVNVTYRHCSAEQLAAETANSYDVVTCMEMLEHVPDPGSVVAACSRLVKPGGQVFYSTINRTPKSFLLAIIGAEYVLNLLPRGTHQYAAFIKPSELDKWCQNSQMEMRNLTGMHYDPLRQKYRLGPGVDVNYIACACKPADC